MDGVIVIVDCAFLPPALALMLTVPTARAVTLPLFTVATVESELRQVIGGKIWPPPASSAVALRRKMRPIVTFATPGITDSCATVGGGTMRKVDVPCLPALDAITRTVPGEIALTAASYCDWETTCAIDGFEVDHATGRLKTRLPCRSATTTVYVLLPPTCTVPESGEIVSDPAGSDEKTRTVARPLFPAVVTVIVTVPAASALTTPFADTVARVLSLVDQMIGWLTVVKRDAESSNATESCHCCPTSTPTESGLMTMDATGAGDGTMICAEPFTPSLVAVIVV